MQRRYITVDVFTDRASAAIRSPWCSTPEGLSTAQMQAIASEFNYRRRPSSCRRPIPRTTRRSASSPALRNAVRRPSQCRHRLRAGDAGAKPPARLLFEEKAGLVPVEVVTEQGRVVSTELTAPQPLKRLSQVGAEQAAACLSLAAGDVKTDRHAPQIVSVGCRFSRSSSLRARRCGGRGPMPRHSQRRFPCDGSDAIYFYTRDVPAGEKPCDLQARMFHPGASGLSEDPATGSATAAAAALLADLDSMRGRRTETEIGQGVDMGRPSLLKTRVRKQGGAITSVHVGGGCVQMMEGTFRLQGEG